QVETFDSLFCKRNLGENLILSAFSVLSTGFKALLGCKLGLNVSRGRNKLLNRHTVFFGDAFNVLIHCAFHPAPGRWLLALNEIVPRRSVNAWSHLIIPGSTGCNGLLLSLPTQRQRLGLVSIVIRCNFLLRGIGASGSVFPLIAV